MSEPERQIIVTIGLPGSGKSTWAKAQIPASPPGDVVRVNRDLLRQMLHGGRFAGDATEDQVVAVEHGAIRVAFTAGALRVIIDDTNLRPSTLNRWWLLARDLGVTFAIRSFLDVPLEECLRRDRERGLAAIGEPVIRRMHEEWYIAALTCVRMIENGHNPFEPVVPKKGVDAPS